MSMRKIEYRYRYDCDNLRLLACELEQTHAQYVGVNKKCIDSIVAYDINEYHAPQCIENLKALLTSSLLFQIQGLLDFHLPKVVKFLAKKKVAPFDKTWSGGNVLCWVKHVLKEDINSSFDFSTATYERLRAFYNIRNDQTHNGGYLSDENRRGSVNKQKGVRISQHSDLYDTDFSYCKSVIDDVEAFLIAVEKNLTGC
ncbi:MAG: hypothetical protein ACYCY5_09300 [Sulfuricella sp.]